jgi:hypothetical protein
MLVPTLEDKRPTRVVNRKTLLWGLGVVAFLNVWTGYCEYVIRSSRLNGSHHFEAVKNPRRQAVERVINTLVANLTSH